MSLEVLVIGRLVDEREERKESDACSSAAYGLLLVLLLPGIHSSDMLLFPRLLLHRREGMAGVSCVVIDSNS